MRFPYLSAAILLVVLVSSTALAWAATATYTPPAEPGQIFTVIDFPRAKGRAQAILVSVESGDSTRNITIAAPYRGNVCSTSTPGGIVLRLRHNQPDSTPVTLVTTGSIVRGPYQGEPPLELLHPCYKLVK
ncbi:MAG TPA: hypothetical protein VGR07_19230 [Thermoanaerobaculia bacterium]|jgi:hypothetical protein|nr:hypothetical protein [Thermoanaerobaculia bacterium]